MDVIILDSITHEWDGPGGILVLHQAMMGNSFTSYAPRPGNLEILEETLNKMLE